MKTLCKLFLGSSRLLIMAERKANSWPNGSNQRMAAREMVVL
jgi:hypothetical protein